MTIVKILLIAALATASAALAVFVGSHISNEAGMTLFGVFCGIVTSIPVSVGLLIAVTRERGVYADTEPEPAPPPPQIIVVERNPQPLKGDFVITKPSTALTKRGRNDLDLDA